MSRQLSSNNNINVVTAADSQTDAPTPEQLIEQLRAMRASIPNVAPLTVSQRRVLRNMVRVSPEVLQAQIDVISASSKIETAIDHGSAEAQQKVTDANRWMSVEHELAALLAGVAGANLIRRQELQLLGAQAYTVGSSLARSPINSELVPHVEQVRRLKRIANRKKKGSSPETPAPQTPPSPAADVPSATVGM